jgi:hypothetical protein
MFEKLNPLNTTAAGTPLDPKVNNPEVEVTLPDSMLPPLKTELPTNVTMLDAFANDNPQLLRTAIDEYPPVAPIVI